MKLDGMILVTGATGKQGGAVAHELLRAGHKVRAMTRKPESEPARELASLGAEVVQADLDDAASLRRATEGMWGVFAVQNTWEAGAEREEAQGKSQARVSRECGVQHYVYTSVGSAHRNTGIPHFDNKWRVEETIRGLGFPSFTIVRPVFFMENLISPWFKPGIDQGKLMVALKPETKLQMIAVRDVGKYGLVAFERHADLNGRSFDIAGDELTMPETAKRIGEAAGHPVTFERLPIEQVRQFSEDYATMLEWFDRVGYDADVRGNAKTYRVAPTSFAEWSRSAQWS